MSPIDESPQDPFAWGGEEEPRPKLVRSGGATTQHTKKRFDAHKMLDQYLETGDIERNRSIKVSATKRRKQINHNPRAQTYLEEKYPGGTVTLVEKTVNVRGITFKKDYLGFIDFEIHTADNITIGVQVTTLKAKSAHISKMAKLKECDKWIARGAPLLLLCYDQPKGEGTRFVPIEFWLTEADFAATKKHIEKLRVTRENKPKSAKKKGWL